MSNQITITENVTTVEVVSNNPTVLEIEQSNQVLVAETGANIPASLGEIRDVDLSPAPTDGQVLTYDATGGVWQPGSIPEVDLSSRLKLDQTIPQQGIGQFDINVKRSKTLVVDAAGRGDYTTIKAACDYVATLAPGSTNQWVIQVLPGYYVEQAFTIPTYCLVQGMGQTPTGNVAHCVQISPVVPWTGGTFITMGSLAAIDNCGIAFTLDASATTDGIGLSGSGRYTRCWFQGVNSASATRNLKMLSGAIAIQNCVVSSGSNNTTLIYSTGGSAIKFCHLSGPGSVGTACNAIVATSGNTSVFFVRFGSTAGTFFNYDIQVTGGAVYVNNSPYKTATGAITHIDKWATSLSGLSEAVAATDVVATLKGATGQTANLLEVKDSADALLASISAAGKISGSALSVGSLSGLLKSTAGLVSAASAGTDFENPLTFSTGLTRAINTVTADLSTGKSGGQSAIGGIGASENLTLQSTAHATKGKILFGNSVYDEVNNRLGIGIAVPTQKLEVNGSILAKGLNAGLISQYWDGSALGKFTFLSAGTAGAGFNFDKTGYFTIYGAASLTDTGAGAFNFLKCFGATGDILIGNNLYYTADTGYKFDITHSGAKGTLRIYDNLATIGSTKVIIRAGAGQAAQEILSIYANDGTTPILGVAAGRLGIGKIGGDAQLDVKTSVIADIGIITRGIAGQTGNLFEARDSSDAILAKINSAGNLTARQLITTYSPTSGSPGITIQGDRPNMLFDCIGVAGGLAFNIMKAQATNTGPATSQIGAVGVFAYANVGGNPIPWYMYFDARVDGAYNKATLKIDANDRVGIGLSGTTKPASKLDLSTALTTDHGIIIRSVAEQTGYSLLVYNPSNVIATSIDANGIVKAAGYQSSDGSAGLTQTVTVRNAAGDGTTVLTFKNGLLTGVA